MIHTGLFIKLPKKRLKTFKKHLEEEHPSTRGNIKIVNTNPRRQVKKMLRSAPNFKKNAADYTRRL